jgi:hypothetical protein
MVTDEDLDRFVRENREFIERMMSSRSEDLFRMPAAAAELTKIKSEKFFRETAEALANPEVQKHFMMAGLEFMAGLSALVKMSPLPDYVKEAASETESNVRQTACMNNKDCPVKNKKKKAAKAASEECAE